MNYVNAYFENHNVVLHKQANLELDCFGNITTVSRKVPFVAINLLLKGIYYDIIYRIQNLAKLLFLIHLTVALYLVSSDKFDIYNRMIKITGYGTLDPLLVKKVQLSAKECNQLGRYYEKIPQKTNKTYARALEYYELGIQKEDGLSLYRYANILLAQGESKESKKILDLYKLAKAKGNVKASRELMEILHELSQKGDVCLRERKIDKALYYFKLAAAYDHPESHYKIGLHHLENWDRTDSYEELSKAKKWLKSSIKLESFEGTCLYAKMYQYEIGMTRNLKKAMKYYLIAKANLSKYKGYSNELNNNIRDLEQLISFEQQTKTEIVIEPIES